MSFPIEDGRMTVADVEGEGARGIVPAHGGRVTEESRADRARFVFETIQAEPLMREILRCPGGIVGSALPPGGTPP